MSAGCVRWVLSRTVRAVCGGSPGYWTPASRLAICAERSNIAASSRRWSPFCTAEVDTEQTPAPKKKKQDPKARATMSSVGRKIPQRQIDVISDTGESLGIMHRADVIRIMDEKGLKLVLFNEHKDPPVYQLMSGKQVHEEQLKLREKQKAKAAPVQVKELSFSSGIAAHDLTTKLKQVESWLQKKHHVRITLRSARGSPAVSLVHNGVSVCSGDAHRSHLHICLPKQTVAKTNHLRKDTTLEQMVQQIGVMVGYVSKPQVKREGKSAMCVLRPPSAKELSQRGKHQAADSSPKASQDKTDPDTTEGSIQQ